MTRGGVLVTCGALLALGSACQQQAGPVSASDPPRPVPASPAPEEAEPSPEASDAGTASELDASAAELGVDGSLADAAPEAASAACAPVTNPPTYDVFFDLGKRPGKWGSELWARVRVPGTALRKEVWASPAPTYCDSQVEGERLTFHCITDEGEARGSVGVVGQELVLEGWHGPPELVMPAPPPFGNPAPSRPPRPFEREASVKVPCGARLRLHPRSEALM
jgi:hypothetical protein